MRIRGRKMGKFKFTRLQIPDLILIEPRVFGDERGFFMETYNYREFEEFGLTDRYVQDNHSKSSRGVLRGLHYQKSKAAQAKLVRVIRGEIFDVAVDIRRGSPTFGKWVGVILSEQNKRQLYIPAGFAHGFCVLSEEAEVLYKVTDFYNPQEERGIIWNDPDIAIDWPVKEPILSKKDAAWPPLKEADNDFIYEG